MDVKKTSKDGTDEMTWKVDFSDEKTRQLLVSGWIVIVKEEPVEQTAASSTS